MLIKRRFKKCLSLMLSFTIALGTFVSPVLADETASANEMTSSMITFFRENRTGLDINAVSRDEIITYGVFLSNFFVPGITQVGDIGNTLKEIDSSGEDDKNSNVGVESEEIKDLAKRVSSKFFGSEGNTAEVQKINDKVYMALADGFKNGLFALNYNGKQLTTTEFFNLLASETLSNGGSVKLTHSNSGSSVVFDLNSDVVRAALKVVYAINPNFITGTDGLKSYDNMFIDGFGNIWVEPVSKSTDNDVNKGTGFDSYVLFLPACLNPAVFKDGDTLKFPVVNSFVMGNIMDIGSNFLGGGKEVNPIEPYYNINKYSTSDEATENSMLSIYGIQSPFKELGKSDNYIVSPEKTRKKLSDFYESDNSLAVGDGLGLMIGIKPEPKHGLDWEDSKNALNSLLGEKNSIPVFKYFNDSLFLPLSSLSDKMTYFNDTYGSNPYGSSDNSWNNVKSPVVSESLFTTDEGKNLYDKAYDFSTFADMLDGTGSNKFLEESEYSDVYNLLFKENIDGSKNHSIPNLNKALESLVGKDKLLGCIGIPFYSKYISNASWIDLFSSKKFTVGNGLTSNDYILSVLMTRFESTGAIKNPLPDSDTFEYSSGTGSIGNYNGMYSKNTLIGVANTMHLFYTYKVFGMLPAMRTMIKDGIEPGSTLTSTVGTKWTIASNIASETNHWPGIYWSYLETLLDCKFNEETGEWTNSNFHNTRLPQMTIAVSGGNLDLNASLSQGSSGLASDENKTQEDMMKDIVKKVYGILSPEENEYRNSLIKATLDSWIISLHRSITGSWVGNVLSVNSGVTNSYSPVAGYINTPNLTDFPLTNWIMNNYMNIYVFLLVLIFMSLIVMSFIGMRSIRQSVLLFVIMAIVLMLPKTFLNNCISLSNSVTDNMFSDRFNYWAITQHQQSIKNLASTDTNSNNVMDIINRNLNSSETQYTSDAGVRVKWMSPKKHDYFKAFFNASLQNSGMSTNVTIFNWLFSGFFNQEEYVFGDDLATYLYRPYTSIASDAKDGYDEFKSVGVDEESIGDTLRDLQNSSLYSDDYEFKLIGRELNSDDLNVEYAEEQKNLIELVKPKNISSDSLSYRLWGMASDSVTEKIFEEEYELSSDAGIPSEDMLSDSGKEFSMLTESPYYYFYNTFKSRYGDSFKSTLLDLDMFIVRNSTDTGKATNKMRDFLDMEGLFTYVIPYLNQANNYVSSWTSIYGTDVPKYDFDKGKEITANGESVGYGDAELKKTALEQVWNLYSPWVDMLYETDVHNVKARAGRKTVRVADALNPGAYDDANRPMIWSEADMYAKNYRVSDLTEVERKIQEVQEKTYVDLMYLVNYYDFDDEVLLNMGAMMATFNFNEVFSKNKVFGESIMLYPQGFELKNFNYDAFMRMTLMNATGEPLMDKQDLYTRVLSKTSVVTGLLLIAEDVIAVIIIPAIKLMTIVLLMFLGLILCVASVINPPEQILKTVTKVVITPAIVFCLANICFAYVVSIFLGEGMTGYVGSKNLSLATNDPTITILLLVIVGCVYTYCMCKLLGVLLKSFKSYGLGVLFSVIGVVAGAGSTLGTLAKNKVKQDYRNRKSIKLSYKQGRAMREAFNDGNNTTNGSSSTGLGYHIEHNQNNNLNNDTSPVTDRTLNSDIEELTRNSTSSDNSRLNASGSNSRVIKSNNSSDSEGQQSSNKVVDINRNHNLKPVDAETDDNGTVVRERKSIGKRMVDIKYSALYVSDKVKDTAHKGKEYVTSGKVVDDVKGAMNTASTFAKDKAYQTVDYIGSGKAKEDIKSGVDTAKTSLFEAKEKAVDKLSDKVIDKYDNAIQPKLNSISNSINDTRAYEKQLQKHRMEKLKSKTGTDTSKMTDYDRHKYDKELTRTKKVENRKNVSLASKKIENMKRRKDFRNMNK